jgi:predicted PurR-regulated permease PerM
MGNRFEQYARPAAVLLLVLGCFLIVQPFLGAVMFAAVLCFSTWPAFVWLRQRLGGRSWLAALVLVLSLVLAFALPVALAAQSIVVHSAQVVELFRGYLARDGRIELPAFVVGLPAIGPWIDEYWRGLSAGGTSAIGELAKRLVDPAKAFFLAIGNAIGAGVVQILVSLFVAYFFYRDGERVRGLLLEGMQRLAGPEQGMALVATTQGAVKGVVYGLIGTAFAQAAVALLGFWIAGVPGAFILAALTFILSLVPMGPVLIWGGAAAWLNFNGEMGWAIFMVIYGMLVISSVDNFVKPILMSRAGNLSMLIVVLGVFGGAIAFGFIGLFLGPALLAVGWNLTKAWLEGPDQMPPANDASSA